MTIKPIIALFRQDVTNALRDNLMIYMLAAPLLLALGARFFLPSLAETKITYAVETAVSPAIIAQLDQLGDVETFSGREAVLERVRRADDVPGIVQDGEQFVVYLEGNEPEGEEISSIVMSSILRQEEVATFIEEQMSAGRSQLSEYGAVALVMLTVMMGALVTGFIMVEEKETKAIQALAVSPLTIAQYTLARGAFAVIFSTLLALIGSAIMVGTAVHYGLLFLGCLVSAALGLVVGYAVGGFTNNQLEAIGLIKILMTVYLTIPIVSIFVPAAWQWLFYALPNYWMFKIFEALYVGQIGPVGFWGAAALTLAVSAVYLGGMAPFLRRTMRLRFA
jgi:ABC-2 type transport system permease protein